MLKTHVVSDVHHVVEYPDIGSAAERSIFQRVQMGVSLTAAGVSNCTFLPDSQLINYSRKTEGYRFTMVRMDL